MNTPNAIPNTQFGLSDVVIAIINATAVVTVCIAAIELFVG